MAPVILKWHFVLTRFFQVLSFDNSSKTTLVDGFVIDTI